jgi:hypothetical protein
MIFYSIFDNSILRFKTKILSNTLLLLLFLGPSVCDSIPAFQCLDHLEVDC